MLSKIKLFIYVNATAELKKPVSGFKTKYDIRKFLVI